MKSAARFRDDFAETAAALLGALVFDFATGASATGMVADEIVALSAAVDLDFLLFLCGTSPAPEDSEIVSAVVKCSVNWSNWSNTFALFSRHSVITGKLGEEKRWCGMLIELLT